MASKNKLLEPGTLVSVKKSALKTTWASVNKELVHDHGWLYTIVEKDEEISDDTDDETAYQCKSLATGSSDNIIWWSYEIEARRKGGD